jgi:putative chitinase
MAIQVTSQDLQNSGIPAKMADKFVDGFNAGLIAVGAVDYIQAAAFLAQTGHESLNFSAMREFASGKAYEGRCKDLGNCQPGDGERYAGRSSLQITGRANYTAFTKWANTNGIPVDFVAEPERLSDPEYAFVGAAWFFNTHKLLQYCNDAGFHTLSRKINGGENGRSDREERFSRAKKALAHLVDSPVVKMSAPAPSRVVAMQTLLDVAADGAWGPKSQAALVAWAPTGKSPDQVKAMQTLLGVTADGAFGPKSSAAQKSWTPN